MPDRPLQSQGVLAWRTAALAALAGCGDGEKSAGQGTPLVGTFKLEAGTCDANGATGSYFRMIARGGTVEKGNYFLNPDSPCPDQSYSVQEPGADGGLVAGEFQPGPKKAFDPSGNAEADEISKPGSFTAIKFAVSTNKVDPQTELEVDAPEIFVQDGKLSGQITAWSAAWNNLYFNQGSPKPDGTTEGLTSPVVGTYDEDSGRFELSWSSTIEGGPFDRFSGNWHLEGTFVASK